jgi:hypothetical protein
LYDPRSSKEPTEKEKKKEREYNAIISGIAHTPLVPILFDLSYLLNKQFIAHKII